MTGNPVNATARAAARRLASTHGEAVETQVEAELFARGADRRPDQYVDPTALGSLIVSVATLAWTVYTDQRTAHAKPSPESVAKQVRDQLRPGGQDDVAETAETAEVIDVVVDEILKNAEE